MTAALYSVVQGPLDAPVLVLAGSLGTTTAMWEPQLPDLVSRFRVVRFDHRGHGRSPSPPGPWSIDDLGADVVALLDELDFSCVSYAGLSLGGMVGMWLAAHVPKRIDRLVLICTSANLDAADSWRARAATVRADGMRAIVEPVVAGWFTPGFAARKPGVVREFAQMLASAPAEGYASCCEVVGQLDLRADLPAVKAPTVVVAAAADLAIPVEHGRAIAATIPAARLVVVPDAAHLATVEQADRITRIIVDHQRGEET